MNVKNAEIIYGNTWIQLDGFECFLGQLSEKWIQRVQQLAIEDHKRWHHSYKSVWINSMIISIVYHHWSIPKRIKSSSEQVFGNLPPGSWVVGFLFCFSNARCKPCQANGIFIWAPRAPPSVLWPHYLRWVVMDGPSRRIQEGDFLDPLLQLAYCISTVLGRSIEQMESPAIIWWKNESIFLRRFSGESSLNLWFSRGTTTLRHQDADGIHHRPFKVQLWQCPILHPCGTWHARSGFYYRCFGIQNAVLLNVAWCWMCVCVCVCLTLGSIISSTFNHNMTILH